MEDGKNKRFDDWVDVDCNDCSHYWDSSCDGASKGARVPCNSFLATRAVVIPERINTLERRVKRLKISCILTDVAVLIHLILYVVGLLNG